MHQANRASFAAAENMEPFRFAGIGENKQVQYPEAGGFVVGITDFRKVLAGRHADINIAGIAQLELGGQVSAGDPLASDAVGKGVEASAGDRVGAYALEAGDDEEVISVLIMQGGVVADEGGD